MNDINIVVVTINHRKFIRPCVESILNSRTSCSFRLFVVDDGSTDGTRQVLETFGDRLTLITGNGGHSFSHNNNLVLRDTAAKYFLVLNPDTILSETSLDEFYQFMEAHPEAGACGPKLIYPHGELQLSCRRFPNPVTVLMRRTPIRYLLPAKARGKRHLMAESTHDRVQQVDWLLGACLMCRGEALRQVNYFDEGFRLYCEDIDLCYRLWQQGWSVYYHPEIVVVHDHQARSDNVLFSRHSWWHYQSMFRYFWKHGSLGFHRPAAPLDQALPLG